VARHFGDLVAAHPGSDEEKAAWMFRRTLTRPPQLSETQKLVAFLQTQRQRLMTGELNAEQLAPGEKKNAVERAAWFTVARVVLNLDEAITKN
ncbi:MAG: Planctomycete cytochrome, partial [Verrucomicrobiales bacterium]|nr:Planctomycete cytochrome [Verrucomicrobiales bacterium]